MSSCYHSVMQRVENQSEANYVSTHAYVITHARASTELQLESSQRMTGLKGHVTHQFQCVSTGQCQDSIDIVPPPFHKCRNVPCSTGYLHLGHAEDLAKATIPVDRTFVAISELYQTEIHLSQISIIHTLSSLRHGARH